MIPYILLLLSFALVGIVAAYLNKRTLTRSYATLRSAISGLAGEGNSDSYQIEIDKLIELTAGKKHYGEIGFNNGHSADTVLANNPTIKVTSFDIGNNDSLQAYKLLKQEYGDRLTVIWGDSRITVPETMPLGCDMFFIDGGHTYDVAMADILNVRRHLQPNSTFIMDDVHCTPAYCVYPDLAWKHILESGMVGEIYNHHGHKG